MPTLLLRLSGPMQSWGTTSRFDERDTQLEPSKSGVLGLLCAALGRDRREPLDDVAALKMGVRVDREGVLLRDYQTATGVMTAAGKPHLDRTVVSPRYYLADAVFLVGLEGHDVALLERLHAAVRAPVWPLALGRKSFPPGEPVWLKDGIRPEGLRQALLDWPSLLTAKRPVQASRRLLLEHPSEGAVRLDQPVSPFAARRFGPRHVVTEVIDVPL
ncbi:MAG: type I-E CRISPR-associated protein Cas5/CasD [Opitutae bacterium]|nr:type I-E CRISPR-associated protein Cas5/CasD [Opitutae bacterium]